MPPYNELMREVAWTDRVLGIEEVSLEGISSLENVSIDRCATLGTLVDDFDLGSGMDPGDFALFNLGHVNDKVLPGDGLVVNRKLNAIFLHTAKEILPPRPQPHALSLKEISIRLEDPHGVLIVDGRGREVPTVSNVGGLSLTEASGSRLY